MTSVKNDNITYKIKSRKYSFYDKYFVYQLSKLERMLFDRKSGKANLQSPSPFNTPGRIGLKQVSMYILYRPKRELFFYSLLRISFPYDIFFQQIYKYCLFLLLCNI